MTAVLTEREWLNMGPFLIKRDSDFHSKEITVNGKDIAFQDLTTQLRGKKWDLSSKESWIDVLEPISSEYQFLGEARFEINGERIEIVRLRYDGVLFYISKKLIVRVGTQQILSRLARVLDRIEDDVVLPASSAFFLIPFSGSQYAVDHKQNILGINQAFLEQLKTVRKDRTKKATLVYAVETGLERAIRESLGYQSKRVLGKKDAESMIAASGTPGLLQRSFEELQELAEVNPVMKEEVALLLIEKKSPSQAAWLRDNLDRKFPLWEGGESKTVQFYLRTFFDEGFLLFYEFDKIPSQIDDRDIGTTFENIYKSIQVLPPWFIRTKDVTRELIPLAIGYDQSWAAKGVTKIKTRHHFIVTPEDVIININSPFDTHATFFHELAHYRGENKKVHVSSDWINAYLQFREKVGIGNDENVKSLYHELIAYTSEEADVRNFIVYLYNQGATSRVSPLDPKYEEAVEAFNQAVGIILKTKLFRNPDSDEDQTYTYIWPYASGRKIKVLEGRLRKNQDGSWEEVVDGREALEQKVTAESFKPSIEQAI